MTQQCADHTEHPLQRVSAEMIRARANSGESRDFYDRIKGRKVTLCGFDLDDGCAGYANVWDAEAEDYEYIDLVDLSCLEAFTEPRDERREFEAWVELCGMFTDWTRGGDDYIRPSVQAAWQAWQERAVR